MSISTSKQVAIGATLFILSSAAKSAGSVTKTTTTGKSSLGIDHLSLDEVAGKNLTICSNDTGESSETGVLGNDLTIPINDAFAGRSLELIFSVSDLPMSDQDHVLLLVSSRGLASSPQLLTPRSLRKLELDLTYNEIIAIYNISQQVMLPQSVTQIGQANSAPISKINFRVNLETAQLAMLIKEGRPSIYVQAALMRKIDLDASEFKNMILSEADKITFINGSDCSGMGAKMRNADGQLTISNRSGTIGLTKSGSTTRFFGLGK